MKGAHSVFSGLCSLTAIWHWVYWDLNILEKIRYEIEQRPLGSKKMRKLQKQWQRDMAKEYHRS